MVVSEVANRTSQIEALGCRAFSVYTCVPVFECATLVLCCSCCGLIVAVHIVEACLVALCLQETAINIGYACSLITDDMTQFQMQGSCTEVDKLEAEGKVGLHCTVWVIRIDACEQPLLQGDANTVSLCLAA